MASMYWFGVVTGSSDELSEFSVAAEPETEGEAPIWSSSHVSLQNHYELLIKRR